MQKTDLESAIVIGIQEGKQSRQEVEEHLSELSFLALTAGAAVHRKFIQKQEKPHPRTFIGSGKLNEVKNYVKENKIETVVFDAELSPSQFKNIEQKFECKVLDRTNLILDIFAKRAQTAIAKTQVELAQFNYLLPRLTRMWTHLSRQKGGIGTKGPGEKEIETDRRIIRNRIAILKEKLAKFEKQGATQRKHRGQKVRVALVGYTNAGKSTLMNVLSKAKVFAEDRLFATLDTTVRKVVLDHVPFLLSDTVGFIRKLPHGLVESFKSTLSEAQEADILVHVVDMSAPNCLSHIKTVQDTLKELNAEKKPTLMVFNKVDAYCEALLEEQKQQDSSFPIQVTDEGIRLEQPEDKEQLPESKEDCMKQVHQSWLAKDFPDAVFISTLEKFNLEEMNKKLLDMVIQSYKETYPYVPLNIYGFDASKLK